MSTDDRADAEYTLGRSEAVELATAWASHRAARIGVRILVLKGPLAHTQGIRAKRTSSDVDILVEPGRSEALISEFGLGGWHERFAPDIPWLIELHSTTLFHARWPIDIDVHHYWPGFLVDRQAAFETMWVDREQHELAGVSVFTPDALTASLVLALHSLRRPASEDHAGDIPNLVAKLRRLSLDNLPALMTDRARLLGATQTSRPFLVALGADVAEELNPDDDLRLWKLNALARGHTRAWAAAISNAPLRKKPVYLIRAVLPSPREMRGLHPELAPGITGLVRGYWRRLGSGGRELTKAALQWARRSGRADV
ncbi:nucleotidyltransferase family protein [Subtercola vilae]|uniref:Nucleotidyltransferase family protein n=1 Tax=Subtercola vilae TaxID=2056433 RepID=A0A4T2C0S2_9MICO|nr:nucleotidyltransferase family protein [Subtercola vilae]TIH35578.1 hypothetical protein D4765_10975 [Subtercola vilae]